MVHWESALTPMTNGSSVSPEMKSSPEAPSVAPTDVPTIVYVPYMSIL